MMPLAPHISLPAIGHMTATTATTPSDPLSTSMSSKPKLAFSIDSIVGRKSSSITDSHKDSDRLSPRLSGQHKSRHSPVKCVRSSSPLIRHRLNERSPQISQQLSPSNQSGANMSPLSSPSPISMSNGSATSPYLEPGRVNPLIGQQTHPVPQTAMGPNGSIPHPLMMAAAHHMSPIPQPYHQAVALYPWLLRANPYANRFHGMPFDGGLSSYLLPPFRKPKRIRTAFSPGQLLKLEQAFEKNHYVVGAERKQLATGLGLSETQVKVWFQNRRTKHKRQKQEEDESNGTGGEQQGNNKHKNSDKTGAADSDVDNEEEEEDEEEDEYVDMDDNDESDTTPNKLLMNSDLKHHQLWYQAMQSAHNSNPISLSGNQCLPSASSSTPKI